MKDLLAIALEPSAFLSGSWILMSLVFNHGQSWPHVRCELSTLAVGITSTVFKNEAPVDSHRMLDLDDSFAQVRSYSWWYSTIYLALVIDSRQDFLTHSALSINRMGHIHHPGLKFIDWACRLHVIELEVLDLMRAAITRDVKSNVFAALLSAWCRFDIIFRTELW